MKQNTDNMKELLNKDLMGQVHLAAEFFNKVNDFNESQLSNKTKQTNNIKLYTEEQVAEAVMFGIWGGTMKKDYEDFLNKLTPIELPSEEKIEKEAVYFSDSLLIYDSAKDDTLYGFREGAKWVIEQIEKEVQFRHIKIQKYGNLSKDIIDKIENK